MSYKTTYPRLIPLEMVFGTLHRDRFFKLKDQYDVTERDVCETGILSMISIDKAIVINKAMIEEEKITEDEMCFRIGLVQTLENLSDVWNH